MEFFLQRKYLGAFSNPSKLHSSRDCSCIQDSEGVLVCQKKGTKKLNNRPRKKEQ